MDWEHVSFCKTPEMEMWIVKGVLFVIAVILALIGAWLISPYIQVPGIARLSIFGI
jgi:uncharacterized membrane protein